MLGKNVHFTLLIVAVAFKSYYLSFVFAYDTQDYCQQLNHNGPKPLIKTLLSFVLVYPTFQKY